MHFADTDRDVNDSNSLHAELRPKPNELGLDTVEVEQTTGTPNLNKPEHHPHTRF